MVTSEPTMQPEDKTEVVKLLQSTLADLIDLSLQVKVAHWNVRGANFRSAHLEFDEIVTIAREELDEVAERISTLDGTARGGLDALQHLTGLPPLNEDDFGDKTVVAEIHKRIAILTGRARETLAKLGDLDPVSEDLIIGMVGRLEKAGWMLLAQIPSNETSKA